MYVLFLRCHHYLLNEDVLYIIVSAVEAIRKHSHSVSLIESLAALSQVRSVTATCQRMSDELDAAREKMMEFQRRPRPMV